MLCSPLRPYVQYNTPSPSHCRRRLVYSLFFPLTHSASSPDENLSSPPPSSMCVCTSDGGRRTTYYYIRGRAHITLTNKQAERRVSILLSRLPVRDCPGGGDKEEKEEYIVLLFVVENSSRNNKINCNEMEKYTARTAKKIPFFKWPSSDIIVIVIRRFSADAQRDFVSHGVRGFFVFTYESSPNESAAPVFLLRNHVVITVVVLVEALAETLPPVKTVYRHSKPDVVGAVWVCAALS